MNMWGRCVWPGGAGRDGGHSWWSQVGATVGLMSGGEHGQPFQRHTGVGSDRSSCVQCSELPMFLVTLTGSTVPAFSPRNSFHKEFRKPKLPVFVLGLYCKPAQNHVLGNPVLLSMSDCKIGFWRQRVLNKSARQGIVFRGVMTRCCSGV